MTNYCSLKLCMMLYNTKVKLITQIKYFREIITHNFNLFQPEQTNLPKHKSEHATPIEKLSSIWNHITIMVKVCATGFYTEYREFLIIWRYCTVFVLFLILHVLIYSRFKYTDFRKRQSLYREKNVCEYVSLYYNPPPQPNHPAIFIIIIPILCLSFKLPYWFGVSEQNFNLFTCLFKTIKQSDWRLL